MLALAGAAFSSLNGIPIAGARGYFRPRAFPTSRHNSFLCTGQVSHLAKR